MDLLGSCLVLLGLAWSCLVLLGLAWGLLGACLVLLGLAWSCLVLLKSISHERSEGLCNPVTLLLCNPVPYSCDVLERGHMKRLGCKQKSVAHWKSANRPERASTKHLGLSQGEVPLLRKGTFVGFGRS